MNKALAFVIVLAYANPAFAESLRDAIASAYETHPVLAEARARQEALSETTEQARAEGRLTVQADAAGGYDRLAYGRGAMGSVSADLPIWTGGRVATGIRAARGDVAAGGFALLDTQAAIIEQVVTAYADLLYAQQAVSVVRADIELLDRQVSEAKSRYELGQATRTDVAQLEAQRAAAGATLANAEGQYAAVAATYRAVVGHEPVQLDDQPDRPASLPTTIDDAMAIARESHPVLKQYQRIAEADAARVDQQRAQGNPMLTLGGTYGYADGRDTGAYNSAAIGTVNLRIPLITGGLVASRVRQAEATYKADRYAVDAAEREVVRAVAAAWANLTSAKTQVTANENRVQAADLALRGVRAEYAFSLRSTLDILFADEALRSAQLALARSRSDILAAQASLLRATGRLDRTSYER